MHPRPATATGGGHSSMAITNTAARELERTRVFDHLVELESRLAEVETAISGLNSKEAAHIGAKQRDAREYLSRGQTERFVVLETLESSDRVLSKIEGIYTFIDPGPYTLGLGDDIIAKIVDVGDNHAEAITIEKNEVMDR